MSSSPSSSLTSARVTTTPSSDSPWSTLQLHEHALLNDMRPNHFRIVTICITLAADVSPTWIRANVIPRLLEHPRFTCKPTRSRRNSHVFEPVLDFANDDHLLDQHIIVQPPISPVESNREQLRLFHARLSDIMSSPLPDDAPLWQLHIFPRWALAYDSRPTSTHLVLRAHAALSDALPLLSFMLAAVPDILPHRLPPSMLLPNARTRPSDISSVPSRFTSRPPWPRATLEAVDDLFRIAMKPILRQPACTLTKTVSSGGALPIMLAPHVLDVPTISRAAVRLGVPLGELLFSAFAGGLRTYLSNTGDDPTALRGLRAAVPVLDDPATLMEVMPPPIVPTIPVPLCVEVEGRRVRLRRTAELMRRVKRARGTQRARPKRSSFRLGSSGCAATFANVVGPSDAVSMAGVDVSEAYFVPGADTGTGVSAGFLAYDGAVMVAVAGDAGRLSKPTELMEAIVCEVEALVAMSYTARVKHGET